MKKEIVRIDNFDTVIRTKGIPTKIIIHPKTGFFLGLNLRSAGVDPTTVKDVMEFSAGTFGGASIEYDESLEIKLIEFVWYECPTCGAAHGKNYKFCIQCGNKL